MVTETLNSVFIHLALFRCLNSGRESKLLRGRGYGDNVLCYAFYQVAGQRTWLSSAVGIARFLPGFVVGVVVGLMVDLPHKNKRLPAKETIREKQKRAAEIRGGVRRGTKAGAGTRASNASPASVEGGGELKMVKNWCLWDTRTNQLAWSRKCFLFTSVKEVLS